MKTTVSLSKYAPSIGSEKDAKDILLEIENALSSGEVVVDFKDVLTMGTNCSKLIFGTLYVKMGSEKFFECVCFANTTNNILRTVRLGIESSLQNKSV